MERVERVTKNSMPLEEIHLGSPLFQGGNAAGPW